MVRAFVESLTIDGSSQSGELRIERLPVPEPRSTGSSFEMVAGVRYEAQKRKPGRGTEVIWLTSAASGPAPIPEVKAWGSPGREEETRVAGRGLLLCRQRGGRVVLILR